MSEKSKKTISMEEFKKALQPKTKRIGIVCIALIIITCILVDFEKTEGVILLLSGGILGLLDAK